MEKTSKPGARAAAILGAAALILGAVWTCIILTRHSRREAPQAPTAGVPAPSDEASIRRFCSHHHKVPPPEVLPRSVWLSEIERMYTIGGNPAEGGIGVPPRDAVRSHYESRAPEALEEPRGRPEAGPGPLSFRRNSFTPPGENPLAPAVSHVRLACLDDRKRPDLLFCDARGGKVYLRRLSREGAPVSVLGSIPNPAHAEVLDLDGDGILDIVAANLGSFEAYDHTKGTVVWLRGGKGGAFEPLTLAAGLGRAADAQAADLDGDGDLDLAAAVFGWRTAGAILFLQNRTKDPSRPSFAQVSLDQRPGGAQVRIADLDGDGKLDIVALVSQKDETIEAFLNRGRGEPFQVETIWAAEHPLWGSSGIDLADLDGDGDLDVIFANGDTLDNGLLVPWHGVRWLENRGEFPFAERLFESFPGCHRAQACDLDGDGDLDIVACALLPFQDEARRRELGLQSIIWLEQVSRGVFERRNLESFRADYPTLDVGDVDGDGDLDIVLGSFVLDPEKPGTADSWITVLENLKVK